MLGWGISIHRHATKTPAAVPIPGDMVASWEAGLHGLKWLDDLVAAGKALDLGGNGYPCRYALSVGALLSALHYGVPKPTGSLVIGDDYFAEAGWTNDVRLSLGLLSTLDSTELLVVDAWDQS